MRRNGMSRRGVLRAGLGIGGAAWAAGALPGLPAAVSKPLGIEQAAWAAPAVKQGVFPDWARFARIADGTFDEDADAAQMKPVINTLKAQNVSVIELDTVLSNWLTQADFDDHMKRVKNFTGLAHAAGIRVVMYYPSLELISVGGEKGRSFYKDDNGKAWVQRSLDGQDNVFYGSLVVWVDPGDESCWLSPNSPWRDYYLARIKSLAATGVDAIWPDVPIYFDGKASWCDASVWAANAFKADTGLPLPKKADFGDPTFRRFVEWRHRNLHQWQLDIAATGKSVNKDLVTFVETVSMDYQYATSIGLDGAYLRNVEGVSHAWEVDILGNYDGMRHATASDWTCLISMYKYARAASGTKPAWAFSYGWKADDASLVMAQLLAAGCNPYEVKSPFKNATTDAKMRTRMYGFVAAHQEKLFNSSPAAEVAVYHSSASRDFVSPQAGTGMYVNNKKPSGVKEWWSESTPEDSCATMPWLGEFRGTVKALVYGHVPFNTVVSIGLSAADLAPYKVVMLPNLQAVSDAEAEVLRGYVAGGGTVVVTGPAPTGLDELGAARAEFALADVLGFRRKDPVPATSQNRFGAGTCWYFKDLLGKTFLTATGQADATQLLAPVRQAAPPAVTLSSGDRRIYLEAGRLGNDTVVQLVNFTGFGDKPAAFATTPAACSVSVTVPDGKRVTAAAVASPDAASPAPQPVTWTTAGTTATIAVTVAQYAVLTVTVE
ncbi:beta-galactosidase trimerization domain-containing protein [Streptomyces luteireticuli]|uniref:beta-galactosidase trimerization domain-containing protein n=1 Tax=Streptomyces luteireticuli TaxID=173858 RepID=UPI0035563063